MITKAFTKFSITTELRKLIVADSGLTNWVGTNVFPIVAPEGTEGDTIIYYREKYAKQHTQFGIYEEKCNVTFIIVSEDYDRSIAITEALNDLIEGIHQNKDNYNYECRLVDSIEDLIDKKYIQTLQFEIK
jgi:hypothetical protein